MVKNRVKRSAFLTLFEKCLATKKTKHLWYSKLGIQPYITSSDPATARSVSKARLNICEIKANFKKMYMILTLHVPSVKLRIKLSSVFSYALQVCCVRTLSKRITC